ncbi:MAG: 5'-nucleotidase [Bacteroidota bacterium]
MSKQILKTFTLLLLSYLFSACSTNYIVTQHNTKLIPLKTKEIIPDSSCLKIILPYQNFIKDSMSKVLIKSDSIIGTDIIEGKINNLIADIVFQTGNNNLIKLGKTKADLCLLNDGGIRTTLPQGEITIGSIFELMPFENKIVAVVISKEKYNEMLNYIVLENEKTFSGIRLEIKNNFIVKNSLDTINKSQYIIITSDYLANGGDNMNFFLNPIEYINIGAKIRDEIIYYLIDKNKLGTLKVSKDQRIIRN